MNGELETYYLQHLDLLCQDSKFRQYLLQCEEYQPSLKKYENEHERATITLKQYIQEAKLSLELLKDIHYDYNTVLLEVGSGLGLVYGFFKKNGYKIIGSEPSANGFEPHYQAAQRMFEILDIDNSEYYPVTAQEVGNLHRKFDIIFSNNVLEHIPEIDMAICEMGKALSQKGLMIHITVNYFIPYEPHFKIPLVPFFPELTSYVRPWLQRSSLWNGLNFVTGNSLKKICRQNGLSIVFKKDVLPSTLRRLDTDESFAERQKGFMGLYRTLQYTGMLQLLALVPGEYLTPMVCIIKKEK